MSFYHLLLGDILIAVSPVLLGAVVLALSSLLR